MRGEVTKKHFYYIYKYFGFVALIHFLLSQEKNFLDFYRKEFLG